MKHSLSHRSNPHPGAIIGCIALCALIWTAPLARAQLPTAQLTSIFPSGGKVGSSIEVRTAGGDQDEVSQIIFSHSGIKASQKIMPATEFEKARPQAGVFEVQIAADVPLGIYEARVVGRFGVSNPRAFVVGVYSEANDPGGNTQPDKALAAALDSTINGVVDNNQIDYFKLPLKNGQRVILDCNARSIDSRLDGTLVIYDASGKELARNRDTFSGDPLLDFAAPADGEYRVALYDFTYRGGAEYFYRLTVHVGPHIDFVFPPSGLPGSNDAFIVYGRNLPGGQPAEGVTVSGAPLQKLTLGIPLPGDENVRRNLELGGFLPSTSALLDGIAYRVGNSNPVMVNFARAPVVQETEPNDQPAQAQMVNFPCEVVGQFYPAKDRDYVAFQAKKGEVYDIELVSHQRGLPTDPSMLIQKVKKNEKGEESVQDVAQVDDPNDRNNKIGSEFDTSTDDPNYRLTADEDAVYRILVRDQFGDSRRDPRMVYRLAIHKGEPDFRLVAVPGPVVAPANNNAVPLGGCCIRKGSVTLIELRVDRRYGFTGDIEVAAEGLPAGVNCPNTVIGANTNSGSLIVSSAEDAARWAGTIRLVGKAKLADKEFIRYARVGTAVWGAGNRQQERTPFRVTRDLAFAVIDRETLPALVKPAEDKVWETSRGGKLEIPIQVTRRGDFKEDLTLAASDIPNELKPQNLVIKGGQADGKLQFAATNGNAKPGLYTFYLRADAKLKHQRNPDAVAAAEQQQKETDALLAMFTEKNKQAAEAKNAAVTAAQTAANGVKQAEQEKATAEAEAKGAAEKAQQAATAVNTAKEAAAKDTNNKALADAVTVAEKTKADAETAKTAADQKFANSQKKLADAQTTAKAADEAKANAEKAAADAEAKVKAAQQAKAAVDKQLSDAKNANNAKDLQFAVISLPIKVKITETCVELSASNPPSPLKQGEKIELPVKINRLYGFEDQVDVTIDFPSEAKGLTANKLTIAKGQSEGKIEITAAKDAPAGDHQLNLRAKARFNNIELQNAQTVTLKVEAASAQ